MANATADDVGHPDTIPCGPEPQKAPIGRPIKPEPVIRAKDAPKPASIRMHEVESLWPVRPVLPCVVGNPPTRWRPGELVRPPDRFQRPVAEDVQRAGR